MFHRNLPSPTPSVLSGVWTHLAFTWSNFNNKFTYYVNGNLIISVPDLKSRPIPGGGKLRLGRLTRADDVWFSGLISQFNIFGRAFSQNEVRVLTRKLHCCNTLPRGDWMSWRNVIDSVKLFGNVRSNFGADCTSFEGMN